MNAFYENNERLAFDILLLKNFDIPLSYELSKILDDKSGN